PSVAIRAFLQSIMPTPVCSRSFIISLLVKLAILLKSPYKLFKLFSNFFFCFVFINGKNNAFLSFDNCSADDGCDYLYSTDSVVVTGDNNVNFIGIAVCVNDSNDGDVE